MSFPNGFVVSLSYKRMNVVVICILVICVTIASTSYELQTWHLLEGYTSLQEKTNAYKSYPCIIQFGI